jgi:Peroxisomal membrane protein (Pex16)
MPDALSAAQSLPATLQKFLSANISLASSQLSRLPSALLTELQTLDSSSRSALRKHARPLRAVGEALRVSAVLSPSGDSELRAEAASAVIALLGVYRDYAPAASPLAAALDAIRAVELLLEMRARRKGESRRVWGTLTAVEAVKAALRVCLLVQRGGRTLTAAVESVPPMEEGVECSCGMRDVLGAESVIVMRGERSGRKILRLHPAHISRVLASTTGSDQLLDPLFVTAYERRAAYLMRMFLPDGRCLACNPHVEPDSVFVNERPNSLEHRLRAPRPENIVGELLYILRPLIQLLLIRRYGWRSWRAWGAAMAVDIAARQCMAPPLDEEDEHERQRRMALMLLYLGRTPFFDFFLRITLSRFERRVHCIPLIGSATTSLLEIVKAVQRYWFYTSGC